MHNGDSRAHWFFWNPGSAVRLGNEVGDLRFPAKYIISAALIK